MSNPESIVTSLDWSKKLKEAGWPDDECCHLWVKIKGHRFVASNYLFQKEPNPERWADPEEVHAAPTAEEILRRLPRIIEHEGYDVFLVVEPMAAPGMWTVGYLNIAEDPIIAGPHENADTLANAAAAMYCYLAEQKLLPK